MPLRSSIKR